MQEKKLSEAYWAEAVHTAVYLINRGPVEHSHNSHDHFVEIKRCNPHF